MDEVGTLKWVPSNESQPAHEELTLLVHAMVIDHDLDQACGGQAECGTCRVRVVAGAENLSPMTPLERELREAHPTSFAPDERLSCMTRPLGDVVIEPPKDELPDLRDLD